MIYIDTLNGERGVNKREIAITEKNGGGIWSISCFDFLIIKDIWAIHIIIKNHGDVSIKIGAVCNRSQSIFIMGSQCAKLAIAQWASNHY